MVIKGNAQMGQIGSKILNFDPNQIMKPDTGLDIMSYDPDKTMGGMHFDPNQVMHEFLSPYNPNRGIYSGKFDPNHFSWTQKGKNAI